MEGEVYGRIGFYRPDITTRNNVVHAIIGKAFIYHIREEKKPAQIIGIDETPLEDNAETRP